MYCNKQYTRKDGLTRHLKGNNSCMVIVLKEEFNTKIEVLKKEIELKDKEIIELKEHNKDLTQQLIDKPKTIINNNIEHVEKFEFNITKEDYFNTKKGFHITHSFIEDRKIEKLLDIVDNYGTSKNVKNLNYYHILEICNTEGEILNGVLISNIRKGELDVKCNNKVDTYTKTSYHFEIDSEMKKIYDIIYNRVGKKYTKQLKDLKDHDTLMNNLRIELNRKGKKIGNDWKQKKEELLCIKDS